MKVKRSITEILLYLEFYKQTFTDTILLPTQHSILLPTQHNITASQRNISGELQTICPTVLSLGDH